MGVFDGAPPPSPNPVNVLRDPMTAPASPVALDLEPVHISPESGMVETSTSRSKAMRNPRVRGLIEAAAHCFGERGVGATTLADISRELGLRKSIIHYYFDNKDALLERVQEYSADQYLQVLKESLTGADPESAEGRAGLVRVWTALREGSANPGLAIELMSEGRRDEDLRARARSTEDQAQSLVAEHLASALGQGRTETEPLAWATLALLHGLMLLSNLEGTADRAEAAFSAYLELLFAQASDGA
jgi:AcrR family transcriptional regulator